MSADDDLLELLGRVLDPPAAEPSMTELASLHRAVDGMHAPASRRRRHRWGPRSIGLLLGLGALTTTGTAFALEGGHLPEPVVSVARTIGIPVAKPAAPTTKVPAPVVPARAGSRPHSPATTATTVVPRRAAPVTPSSTVPSREAQPTTTITVDRESGDDHSGHDGRGDVTTTSTTVRPTTSTTRVDNSGPGSGSGSDGGGSDGGHGGNGGGSSGGSGSGGHGGGN